MRLVAQAIAGSLFAQSVRMMNSFRMNFGFIVFHVDLMQLSR